MFTNGQPWRGPGSLFPEKVSRQESRDEYLLAKTWQLTLSASTVIKSSEYSSCCYEYGIAPPRASL